MTAAAWKLSVGMDICDRRRIYRGSGLPSSCNDVSQLARKPSELLSRSSSDRRCTKELNLFQGKCSAQRFS